jgi:hypothetical protein
LVRTNSRTFGSPLSTGRNSSVTRVITFVPLPR